MTIHPFRNAMLVLLTMFSVVVLAMLLIVAGENRRCANLQAAGDVTLAEYYGCPDGPR